MYSVSAIIIITIILIFVTSPVSVAIALSSSMSGRVSARADLFFIIIKKIKHFREPPSPVVAA